MKYEVTLKETEVYTVEVLAESSDEAAAIAWDLLRNSEDRTEYQHAANVSHKVNKQVKL